MAGFFIELDGELHYSSGMVMLMPHTPRFFTALGMGLALALFSISLFGFPPFHTGYWNAEPITLAMFIICTAIALWLALAMFCGWLQVRYARGHALLLCWLAWLAWQAIVTAFSPNAWQSWFGPPEQSEGLAWYVCASLFMLQLAALWHSPRFRVVLLSYSFALMLVLSLLHLVSDEQNNMFAGFFFPHIPERYFTQFLPFVWPDYLGFIAGWWWVACMLTFPALRLRVLLPLAVLTLIILVASSNHGALALISYALLIVIIVRILHAVNAPLFRHVSFAWRRLAILALLLPAVWLIASPYIPTSYTKGVSQSVPTRILLNHISMRALAEEPNRLLLGKGWGRFEDDFYKYGLVRDIRTYSNGKHDPNWTLIRGYNYHSHNMAAETLLSLGLVGFLLWLIMPVIAVRQIPALYFWAAVPMLVGVRLLSHLWFTMPQTMPYQALCWFLLMHKVPAQGEARPVKFLLPALLWAAAMLAWSTTAQIDAMRYSTRMADPFGQRYGTPVTAEFMQTDIKRGGDRLRSYFIQTTKRLSKNEAAVQEKHIALYRVYLESMEKLAADPRTGAYNGSSVLYGYNVLMTTLRDPLFKPLRQHASSHYFDMVKIHTRRAPQREDSMAPFLDALYHSARDTDHQQLMAIVQELLAINPAHRSALWMGGKVLSEKPGFAEEGREMMETALKLGADRVFMIPEAEVQALLKKQ